MTTQNINNLPFDIKDLKREQAHFYISLSKQEIEKMLSTLKIKRVDDLFSHIPSNFRFDKENIWANPLPYGELATHLEEISKENKIKISFIGDSLKNYQVPKISEVVANIRGLATAYTPYQPERSQGTLQSIWIYSSLLSMLTGFEAVNASLYDRSTAIFEAIKAASRLNPKCDTVLVAETIHNEDKEVLQTFTKGTKLKIKYIPIDNESGITDLISFQEMIKDYKDNLVGVVFSQVNSLGLIENFDKLTDISKDYNLLTIAVIDPMLLANGGLKPPAKFGTQEEGVDIIVGEGQHLGLPPTFGGPGIGIFGIRYNEKNRNNIRHTPGRFVSKAKDIKGRECKALVLSTREQHIRRDKATSNICSNQSLVASIIGAAILERGDEGLKHSHLRARLLAKQMAVNLTKFEGIDLVYPKTPFYHELLLTLPCMAQEFIDKASSKGIHVGVVKDSNQILISFSDVHSNEDVQKLYDLFSDEFKVKDGPFLSTLPNIPISYLRDNCQKVGIPKYRTEELEVYYRSLGRQNVGPEDLMYPLGSCTMKYNPYINEFCANLDGFINVHPQSPISDVQGSLRILFEIQEMFKAITGLDAVTTQPVAGAQGELVGLKMFQAFFEDKKESKRDLILIPKSAHGTNPATVTVAAYKVVEIDADEKGMVDINKLKDLLKERGDSVAGIMITNPNTSGIFEERFIEVSNLIHTVGGLVYMDGANLNAIAGYVDLKKIGVDAVHSNLHKTWSIPHGGGGPGDAIVAVSDKLVDYLPGIQVVKDGQGKLTTVKPSKSIGSVHRHFGNFQHKVRCYTYLKALGAEGVKKMSSLSVLSSRYLYHHLREIYAILPKETNDIPRMHEFIISLPQNLFEFISKIKIKKTEMISKIGKLFLDFGVHSPTVSFPEAFGLMIEPTESYSKKELDRFVDIVKAIYLLICETPEVLLTTPHFTPVDKIDEISANKNPQFYEKIDNVLGEVLEDRIRPEQLAEMNVGEICKEILTAHKK